MKESVKKEIEEIMEKFKNKDAFVFPIDSILEMFGASPIKFENRIDWSYLSRYGNLSEDFMREFKNRIDWHWASGRQKLSEDFIREVQNKVYWGDILQFQKLSESFIREMRGRINKNEDRLKFVREHQNISNELRQEINIGEILSAEDAAAVFHYSPPPRNPYASYKKKSSSSKITKAVSFVDDFINDRFEILDL
jgi:hypothetical protein